MGMVGFVDIFNETQISGWAADDSQMDIPVYVDIIIGPVRVASLRCSIYRKDLQDAGIGDGRKCFLFDPSQYLALGPNEAKVRFSGSDTVIPNGSASLIGTYCPDLNRLDEEAKGRLLRFSQGRWKGTEEDRYLTWGRVMTGDSFLDAIENRYTFDPNHHVCEIGPGYGRLLKTILGRSLPFGLYTGVELSQERVNKLNNQFANERIKFICADVNDFKLEFKADLVICSATFEHLFPDFSRALGNLVDENLSTGGAMAIDFIQVDEAMKDHWQTFEPIGHAFVRVYSSDEIQEFFVRSGLTADLSSIVLGQSDAGEVKRMLAFARPMHPGKIYPPPKLGKISANAKIEPLPSSAEFVGAPRTYDQLRVLDRKLNDLSEQVGQLQDRLNRYTNVLPLRWIRRVRANMLGLPPHA